MAEEIQDLWVRVDQYLAEKEMKRLVGAVVARGRVVATWSQAEKRRRLQITVEPLELWRVSKHARGVKKEARVLAAHLGLEEVDVKIGKP